MVDFGAEIVPPPVHMPTIRWLSASIAWIRASSDPVRGWIFLNVLPRLNTDSNTAPFIDLNVVQSSQNVLQNTTSLKPDIWLQFYTVCDQYCNFCLLPEQKAISTTIISIHLDTDVTALKLATLDLNRSRIVTC